MYILFLLFIDDLDLFEPNPNADIFYIWRET